MAKVVLHLAGRGGITPPTPLTSEHDSSRFNCGNEVLNDWLKKQALKSQGKTAQTYVVCDDNAIMGYYCILAGSIERAKIPKSLKKHGTPNPIPVAIIGRLARDLSQKGTALGQDLLSDALHRIAQASHTIGIRAVLVHAIDEKAAEFWKTTAGFLESPIETRTFFLPIETIIEAITS
ncbi:GNAT family N-acetyltransferase [Bradyrhizobium elkanii]